jgi:5-methyltetrahydropteroyltriglutamate--homocysteine methyltransferase
MCKYYRAEIIGSLLRPVELKEAREKFQQGLLSPAQFKKIEDRAVDAAIRLQEQSGIDAINDGEQRRALFIGPLTDYVDGFGIVSENIETMPNWRKSDEAASRTVERLAVIGKLRRQRSLASEEYVYLRARTTKPIKMTLPSPLMLSLLYSPKHSAAAYPDPFQLFADAVDIVRNEVRELVSLGCTYIQIDAPELATLVDPATRQNVYEAQGISTDRMLSEGIEMLNAVADAPGVTFGMHLCRGNNAGAWMSSGGYETISKQVFKRATRFSRFFLEYDDYRSGSFEALRDIPTDKTIVLGLVSTKKSELEPIEGLAARVEDASKFFPREQMAVSTQCGFAGVAAGNPISVETQTAKLNLVSKVAHRCWTQ